MEKNLQEMGKDELVALCEKQEKEIVFQRDSVSFWADRCRKLEKKLETLKNIVEL